MGNDNGTPYPADAEKTGQKKDAQTFKHKNTCGGNNGRNNAVIQGSEKGRCKDIKA